MNTLAQLIILLCTLCHQRYQDITVMTLGSRLEKRSGGSFSDFGMAGLCINNKAITWSNADLKSEKP